MITKAEWADLVMKVATHRFKPEVDRVVFWADSGEYAVEEVDVVKNTIRLESFETLIFQSMAIYGFEDLQEIKDRFRARLKPKAQKFL